MNAPQIAPYKLLPPQRWGFLPTNDFWHHAALTPISLIFWAGVAVFFSFVDFFAFAWWQQPFVWMTVWWVWAGLVERYTRRYLARRQMQALAAPRADPQEPLTEPPGPPSRAPVPSRTTGSSWALVQRAESWDLAYESLFGRGAKIARIAFDLAFGLAIFHPSWIVKLLGFLALLAAARGVGSWERRQAMAAGESASGPPPLPGGSPRGTP